jgi:hypothetical protein
LDAVETDPQGILTGDHNITNGTAIRNGILELTTNHPAGWTAKMHGKSGIIVSADGSVQMTGTAALRAIIADAGTFTNHLLMPVFGP